MHVYSSLVVAKSAADPPYMNKRFFTLSPIFDHVKQSIFAVICNVAGMIFLLRRCDIKKDIVYFHRRVRLGLIWLHGAGGNLGKIGGIIEYDLPPERG